MPAGRSTKAVRKFVIRSSPAAAARVLGQVMRDVSRRGFNEHSAFAIRLALGEALINAVLHGNKLDTAKRVTVRSSITPKRAEIVVEDQGSGFNRRAVPDCTRPRNLPKAGGRGILLIESYMNRVQWSHGGRRVRMIKINGKEAGP
jgi:serine/threonine-protein kinase RsbW